VIEENDKEKTIFSWLCGNLHPEKKAVTVLHISKQGSFELIFIFLELNICEGKQKGF